MTALDCIHLPTLTTALPAWESLHPAASHLPVGTLMALPFLLVLALLMPSARHGLEVAALVVLILGTLGAVMASVTGEAAIDASGLVPVDGGDVDRHRAAGHLVLIISASLSVAMIAWMVAKSRVPALQGTGVRIVCHTLLAAAAATAAVSVWVASMDGCRAEVEVTAHLEQQREATKPATLSDTEHTSPSAQATLESNLTPAPDPSPDRTGSR